MARRSGARFRPDQLLPARCPLLGYALRSMQIEGALIPQELLQVEAQAEVGTAGYDAGAAELRAFFADTLRPYLRETDLEPLGRSIIEAALAECDVQQFAAFEL